MAWRRPGDKPLAEPMMVSLPMHICVVRPQWVKIMKQSDLNWLMWDYLRDHSISCCRFGAIVLGTGVLWLRWTREMTTATHRVWDKKNTMSMRPQWVVYDECRIVSTHTMFMNITLASDFIVCYYYLFPFKHLLLCIYYITFTCVYNHVFITLLYPCVIHHYVFIDLYIESRGTSDHLVLMLLVYNVLTLNKIFLLLLLV